MGVTVGSPRSGQASSHTSRAIDVIRGLAALGVIWGHAIYGFRAPLELNGAFWVWIFLPISGYLVAKSFEPGRLWIVSRRVSPLHLEPQVT